MLFPRTFLASSLLLLFFSIVIILHLTRITSNDQLFYQKLMEETHELHASDTLERHPNYQSRDLSQKELWLDSKKARHCIEVKADHSELFIHQKQKAIQAEETLKDLVFELESAAIHAKEGSFQYPSSDFFLKEVVISHHLGTIEATKAYLHINPENADESLLWFEEHTSFASQGSIPLSICSQSALCTLSEPSKNEKIEFFDQVELKSSQGLSAKSSFAIYEDGLLMLRDSRFVFLQDDEGRFTIHADQLDLLSQEEEVLIKGNIHLFSSKIQNKQSFALADQIRFDPTTRTLLLSAEKPKRVLFWQEGIRLSAPEISIEKDPLTREDKIQGKGDIRLTFNLEEENIIQQFMQKYL